MPTFPFVDMLNNRARKDPLGPTTVNQIQENALSVDEMARVEHLPDGQHNALEVPWVLGRIQDGSPPTGFLFDTTYGGGTLARPGTGEYTASVAAGVVPTAADGVTLRWAGLANVASNAIEAKPHTITVEAISATSFRWRVRELSSAIGAGNAWASVNRDIDVAIFAPQRAPSPTLLSTYAAKQRRDFLAESPSDWNALVVNQGRLRKAALLEHSSSGDHNVNRIARAVGWFNWGGASYSIAAGQRVSSVSRISAGVVEVTVSDNFTSTNSMACFPEVQPSTFGELCIINGRGFNTGAGTSRFRFYIYAFAAGVWSRADRSFFAPMFGAIA